MLPLLPQPSAIPDKCEGDSCKCPPGLVGVQPFCRQPGPEPVTGKLQIYDDDEIVLFMRKKNNEYINVH